MRSEGLAGYKSNFSLASTTKLMWHHTQFKKEEKLPLPVCLDVTVFMNFNVVTSFLIK